LSIGIAQSLRRRSEPAPEKGAVVLPGATDHPLATAFPMFSSGDPDARVRQALFETLPDAMVWLGRPADYDPADKQFVGRRDA